MWMILRKHVVDVALRGEGRFLLSSAFGRTLKVQIESERGKKAPTELEVRWLPGDCRPQAPRSYGAGSKKTTSSGKKTTRSTQEPGRCL